MINDSLEIVPVSWEVRRPGASEDERMSLDVRIIDRGVGGQHAYAIVRSGSSFNKSGKWEHEPLPNSRNDDYKRRCRWEDFDEVVEAAREAYVQTRKMYSHYLDKD